MITRLKALIIMIALLLSACSANEQLPQTDSEQALYETIQQNLDNESYMLAVQNLQTLESRYPFGRYAEQGQLELIYAHYQNYEPEASIAAAERFIRLHPQHPNVDYAYYMKGLANYSEGEGFLDRFLPTDMTQRDPGAALKSFEDFRQLLTRFPSSPYAADAKARMIFLRSRLARYEINVANYYFKRGAYIAAANRGRYVVEHYPQTAAVGDALAVMVQAYQLLGLNDLANDSLAVLRLNHPQHPSLDANGGFNSKFSLSEENPTLLSKLTLGLLGRPEPPKFDNRAEFLQH